MTPRLKEIFNKEIQPALKDQFGFKNIYMAPRIEKVVLNMGLGLDATDSKILKSCEEDMAKIAGQKPVTTKFKKSVANFKTRKGSNAGLKVTLRKNRMYEFIDRLVNIALPRIKDFQGLSKNGFDKSGNFSFGIKEHIIFPEINFDKVDRIRGMDITIVTSGKNKAATFALLEAMNFPFIKKSKIPVVIKADGLASGKGVTVCNSTDEAFNSNDKGGEINEDDTSSAENSPICNLEHNQKSSERSSERKLRKRKINLNDLSSNLTCPKVCHFSNCGIQLPTSSALEWHYEGHFAQELEKLEKLKVKKVTAATERDGDDLVLRRPVRNSAVDRIRLNRQRRLARKTIDT